MGNSGGGLTVRTSAVPLSARAARGEAQMKLALLFIVVLLAGAAQAQVKPTCVPPETARTMPNGTVQCVALNGVTIKINALGQLSPSFADPASVLVIVQDNSGPETGTGGKNASRYVADYYMRRRGIPAGNVVHVATHIDGCSGPGGLTCDLTHSDSINIRDSDYQSQILAPILAKLNANNGALRSRIKYIVPVYGVPVTVWTVLGVPGLDPLSLDGKLSTILLASTPAPRMAANPYYSTDPVSSPPHIDVSTSGVLLVSRLDGPSAVMAAALVDKAIAGETAGVKGTGYFDYQGLGAASNGGKDTSMLNAYNLCAALTPVQTCVLNNQQPPPTGTGHMITSAPNTAWAWGWYDLGATNASAYTFATGAVGAQLTSNSANCIRRPCSGGYVAAWLAAGITATWGAVSEPYSTAYALGDNLLSHLWRGYTFGESAYISSPVLNWMMVFVGDPLYRPKL